MKFRLLKIFFIFNYLLFFLIIYNYSKNDHKIKIGIFGCRHDINIGNYLIKFAMHIKLKELCYDPYIVTTNHKNVNISFINHTTNIILIKNYSQIKENDFDILLVNSDQTWRKWDKYFYDCGFLKFAEKWNKLKFVYGASLGFDYWDFNKKDEKIIKPLLKDFSDISVRERGSIKLIKAHLNIIPKFVLDPTLIIDKKYYLDLIKNYNDNNQNISNYIFLYGLYSLKPNMKLLINKVKNELNYDIHDFNLNNNSLVEDFIYYLKNSKGVITNSYHCTIFSIIFNKPFITFNYKHAGIERIKSLSELLGFENRIVYNRQNANISLLKIPLEINNITLNHEKIESINYLKKNLNLYKIK